MTLIAVRDKITGRVWNANGGIHVDLVITAERELGLTARPQAEAVGRSNDDRFDARYIAYDGCFFSREQVLGPARLCKFHAEPPLSDRVPQPGPPWLFDGPRT